MDGRTKPFADSLETFIDVDIKDLNIPHYLAYVPVKMNFKIAVGLPGYIGKDIVH